MFTNGGSTIGICTTTTFWIPMTAICASFLWSIFGQHQKCTEWLFLPLLWVGGSFMVLIQLSPSYSINMVGHAALGTWKRVTWSCCLSYMVWMGDLSWVSAKSVVGIKTWWFWCGDWVSAWWIYSHLIYGVLICSITYLPCYHGQDVNTNPLPAWTRVVEDFEHGLDLTLVNAVTGCIPCWDWD